MTSALTRRAVLEEGVCTLGAYLGNAVGLRRYHRLRYQVGQVWHSRLPPAPHTPG